MLSLIILELFILHRIAVSVNLFAGLFTSSGGQVSLLEEFSEKNKVAEVHGQTKCDIDARNVAVDLAAFQVLISRYVYKAADNHLC